MIGEGIQQIESGNALRCAWPFPFRVRYTLKAIFVARPAIPWGRTLQRKSNRDFAAGFRCLIPAAPAVPAAAAKQQNDKYDDEKRVGIHVELLLALPPACFRTSRFNSRYNNLSDPYPFL